MWECLTKKMRQKNLKKKINSPSACFSTRGSDPSPSVRSVALGEGGVRLSGNKSLSRVSGGGSRGKPSRPDFPTAHLLNPSTLPPPPPHPAPTLRHRAPPQTPPTAPEPSLRSAAAASAGAPRPCRRPSSPTPSRRCGARPWTSCGG
jgi:hypothetical protein